MLKTYQRFRIEAILCLIAGPFVAATLKPLGIGAVFGAILTILGALANEESTQKKRELTIKSRLDEESLGLLISLNGLMFIKQIRPNGFIETARYLIQQDVIRNEVFPPSGDGKITFGYYLTDFGKDVLQKHIGIIKLFPSIIIDLHRVRYWLGHKKDFPYKKQEFAKKYNINFDDYAIDFFNNIPNIKNKQNYTYEEKLDFLSKFLENNGISYEDKMKVINKLTIKKGVNMGKISRFKKNDFIFLVIFSLILFFCFGPEKKIAFEYLKAKVSWLMVFCYFFSVLFGSVIIRMLIRILKPRVSEKGAKMGRFSWLIGALESFAYTTAWVINQPGFIALWIGVKMAGRWGKRHTDDKEGVINVFLIGNLLTICVSVLAGQIIKTSLK